MDTKISNILDSFERDFMSKLLSIYEVENSKKTFYVTTVTSESTKKKEEEKAKLYEKHFPKHKPFFPFRTYVLIRKGVYMRKDKLEIKPKILKKIYKDKVWEIRFLKDIFEQYWCVLEKIRIELDLLRKSIHRPFPSMFGKNNKVEDMYSQVSPEIFYNYFALYHNIDLTYFPTSKEKYHILVKTFYSVTKRIIRYLNEIFDKLVKEEDYLMDKEKFNVIKRYYYYDEPNNQNSKDFNPLNPVSNSEVYNELIYEPERKPVLKINERQNIKTKIEKRFQMKNHESEDERNFNISHESYSPQEDKLVRDYYSKFYDLLWYKRGVDPLTIDDNGISKVEIDPVDKDHDIIDDLASSDVGSELHYDERKNRIYW